MASGFVNSCLGLVISVICSACHWSGVVRETSRLSRVLEERLWITVMGKMIISPHNVLVWWFHSELMPFSVSLDLGVWILLTGAHGWYWFLFRSMSRCLFSACVHGCLALFYFRTAVWSCTTLTGHYCSMCKTWVRRTCCCRWLGEGVCVASDSTTKQTTTVHFSLYVNIKPSKCRIRPDYILGVGHFRLPSYSMWKFINTHNHILQVQKLNIQTLLHRSHTYFFDW